MEPTHKEGHSKRGSSTTPSSKIRPPELSTFRKCVKHGTTTMGHTRATQTHLLPHTPLQNATWPCSYQPWQASHPNDPEQHTIPPQQVQAHTKPDSTLPKRLLPEDSNCLECAPRQHPGFFYIRSLQGSTIFTRPLRTKLGFYSHVL